MQPTQKQVDYCMECGICTGSCPVSYELPGFSPRQILKRAISDNNKEALLKSRDLWACLSCSRCSSRCPVEIDFPEFIRSSRSEARKTGALPFETHHGIFQTIARIQTGGARQQRIDWAREAGTIKDKGDVFFFVGCLPYFDIFFEYLDLSMLDPARSTLKLLNMLGIDPVISNDECCCGHDALWSGDEETFKALAGRNLEVIGASGAKTVLFNCPEGYHTFREYYPAYMGELPFDVMHISEFLALRFHDAELEFNPSSNGAVTYHDPCRLGRMSGKYKEPRELLNLVPGTRLVEMKRNRENALCCGTSSWMECSNCSKAMRMERLQEARETGAETLITACPKCGIHFKCALSNSEMELGVKDLCTYLLENLRGDQAQEE